MKIKPVILVVVVLVLLVGGAAAATTFGGSIINLGTMWAQRGMDIRPEATPETGSLINALDEAGFVIDEAGNVNIPNVLTFGEPEPAAPVAYTDDGSVSWAYGVANVYAAGEWIDSHPIESPTGAACAIISPYDEYPIGETDVAVTTVQRNLGIASVYNLWEPSFCELTQVGGNATGCVIEKVGNAFYIRALQANGSTATSVTGARATWQAHITKLDFHSYTCGIMRDPSEDDYDILAWKKASLEASRIPDDQFFVFVKDEQGEWFHADELCLEPGCPVPDQITEGHYQGIQVAWFIWKVAE